MLVPHSVRRSSPNRVLPIDNAHQALPPSRLGTMTRPNRPSSWIGSDVDRAFSDQFFEVDLMLRACSAFTAPRTEIGLGQTEDGGNREYHEEAANATELDHAQSHHSAAETTTNSRALLLGALATVSDSERRAKYQYEKRVSAYSADFKHGSTLPHNGFLGFRTNQTGHPLKCTSCPHMIDADPKEPYVAWEHPDPKGYLHDIHMYPCFVKLYTGEFAKPLSPVN